MTTNTISRPVLRYHGGKWRIAKWIIGHFPLHTTYCEPYAGAASVLLTKPRSPEEIYNDIDERILNVFRVLRDKDASAELIRALKLTSFSRAEMDEAFHGYDSTLDIVEQARKTIILSFFGFGSDSATRKHKASFSYGYAKHWNTYTRDLDFAIERLQGGVVLENLPALKLIKKCDSEETLFYVDPPYVTETRGVNHRSPNYRFEMTAEEHEELSHVLKKVKGMVLLSGYRSELYDRLYPGWVTREKRTPGMGRNGPKMNTETLWISDNAVNNIPPYVLFKKKKKEK